MKKNDMAASPCRLTVAAGGNMTCLKTITMLLMLIFIAGFGRPAAGQATDISKKLKGFDQYMEKALKDWNTPGACVGIVVKDKLVFAKGYGYRDFGKKLPVTPKISLPDRFKHEALHYSGCTTAC